MKHKVAMAIMALLAGGCLILTSLPASAEPGQQQHQKKAQGQSRGGGGDGCQLRWQEVETVEGDDIYQCVAYCPRQ